MYFVGTDDPYWQQVRNAMKNADYTQWNNDLVKDITATENSGMKYLARWFRKDRPRPVLNCFEAKVFMRLEQFFAHREPGQPALESACKAPMWPCVRSGRRAAMLRRSCLLPA